MGCRAPVQDHQPGPFLCLQEGRTGRNIVSDCAKASAPSGIPNQSQIQFTPSHLKTEDVLLVCTYTARPQPGLSP